MLLACWSTTSPRRQASTLARMVGLALERAQLASQVAEVQALARTEELKTALLSSVSHDLRTPLTAIRTSASSLLTFKNQFDPETSQQLLSGIVDECDRLNHLTANLLEMTRLQGGTGNIRRSVLPVAEITRNAVSRQRRFAGSRGFSFKAPRRELFIEADTALFELALANVLQNAIQYSASNGSISVTCEEEGAECMISVTDNGMGIPAEEHSRVFQRFYRVERSGNSPKGTGLGLAIAKGFVEASNGTIAIQSPVSDGRGTSVTIRLPLAANREIAE
jgi:two-component system, OmpR family, sensor histidine kinase KdpD